MSLKAMILGTPLEPPARSVMRVVRRVQRGLRPVTRWFSQRSKHIRFALAAEKHRKVGDIDVVICSPGGVATTMLLQHFARFLRTNAQHDEDGLKHVPYPELILSDADFRGRMVYIYGDIDSVVASIERRGWVRFQGAKLGSLAAALLPRGASRTAFASAVSAQIGRFVSRSDPRLMTLRFDEIWDNAENLAVFLDIEDPDFLEHFPERKRRLTEPAEPPDAIN